MAWLPPVFSSLARHLPRSISARRRWGAYPVRRHHLPDAGREAARRFSREGRAARESEEFLAARLVLLPGGDSCWCGGDPAILIGAESTPTSWREEAA